MTHGDASSSAQILKLLRDDHIIQSNDATATPLTGGVSSEIYRIDDGPQTFVVKRALAKLRVRDDWSADVSRNRFEQRYLCYVGQFLPAAVPRLRDARPDHGYFTMEYLSPEFVNWKQLLLTDHCEIRHALMAADVLGKIHAHSARDAEAARLFDTTANFRQLRTEPYFLTLAPKHPEFAQFIEDDVNRLESTRLCLVHGDFSPKNMLIHGDRLVLLDCEVAWYGDPAFDAAFLLNHLFLKSLFHAPADIGLSQAIDAFWKRYLQLCAGSFDSIALEQRTCKLLLLLMLARIDGKSPVEYLSNSQQQLARQFVLTLLPQGHAIVAAVASAWFSNIKSKEV